MSHTLLRNIEADRYTCITAATLMVAQKALDEKQQDPQRTPGPPVRSVLYCTLPSNGYWESSFYNVTSMMTSVGLLSVAVVFQLSAHLHSGCAVVKPA
jgi:hypothetical protein